MKSEMVYALVDCNSFFCSCEKLFRPDLRHRPVGVLSNNDGCFVALTRDLKDLGVPMGGPYFQYREVCKKNNVAVFSSNFSLYTNISDRVMSVLAQWAPELEVYSVDEAFLNLTGFKNLDDYVRQMKVDVERKTGIPVGIGIGPTKTLAKIANHIAKKSKKSGGVVNLMETRWQDEALARVTVQDIWGVGRASAYKLRQLNINTAKDYRDFKNERLIKKILTKVGLQRKEELSGKPRFFLNLVPKKKKSIIASRSFGQAVLDFEPLRESVAHYVSSACEKLRSQESVCAGVEVYVRTSLHKNVDQYHAIQGQAMLSGTSDTRKVIRYALHALNKLYRAGYVYKKAGVKLYHIRDSKEAQMSLLEQPDNEKTERLMQCMDAINRRDGGGTVVVAECGTQAKAWAMNSNYKSPRYLTGWTELKKVY